MMSLVTGLTDQHLRIIPRFPEGYRTHYGILSHIAFCSHFACGHTSALTPLPAGLALFAFRALPAGTLAGSQSSVQTGSMIVMPTAGTEEEVAQLPRPLTHCTASLLCSREEGRVQVSCGMLARRSSVVESYQALHGHRRKRLPSAGQIHAGTVLGTADSRVNNYRQSPCTHKVSIYLTGTGLCHFRL